MYKNNYLNNSSRVGTSSATASYTPLPRRVVAQIKQPIEENNMNKRYRYLIVPAIALAVLAGCEREGPAERAGKQIDQTTERAGENIESATDKAGDKLEDAGDKVRDKTNHKRKHKTTSARRDLIEGLDQAIGRQITRYLRTVLQHHGRRT